MLSNWTRAKLKTVSTATICTALFKRGFRNQFIQDVRPLNSALPPMVGEAFTLRYIPAREDLNPITVFQDRSHPQRKAVEDCPPGAVFVIDSRKDPRAASAGSILVTRLMVRGVAGVVTDGGFRNSPEIAQLAQFRRITIDRQHQPISQFIKRSTSMCRSRVVTRPYGPGTLSSATARAWSLSRRIWPTRSPTKLSR